MPDREKVLKGLEVCSYSTGMECIDRCPYSGSNNENNLCVEHLVSDALELLKAPAADAVPVVHSQWIEKEFSDNTIIEWQTAKCSICGKYHTTPYLYYFKSYNYCPNCGAKMDGERRG